MDSLKTLGIRNKDIIMCILIFVNKDNFQIFQKQNRNFKLYFTFDVKKRKKKFYVTID